MGDACLKAEIAESAEKALLPRQAVVPPLAPCLGWGRWQGDGDEGSEWRPD